MSELNNPLLANGLANFDPNNIDYDALQDFQPGINHEENEFTALHTNHRGYIGEDGNIYRKELTYNKHTGEFEREYTDERLYFWTPPQELGDRGLDGDQAAAQAGRDKFGAAGLYTKAEIAEAFNADEGMGYLKKANPGLTFDKYFSFIERTTELFTDPNYNDMTDGNMVAGNFQESPEYMALMEEYGIQTQYVNSDGDVFNWNGTGYSKDFKVDDSFDVHGFVKGIAMSALTAGAAGFLAPVLAGSLGVSNSVAKGLITSALNIAQGKDVDIGTALSLVGADVLPGGATLGEMVEQGNIGQDVLDAIVGEITNPDNYGDGDNRPVWSGHGGTDEMGNPVINIPNYEPLPTDENGGGGGTQDSTTDGGASDAGGNTDLGGDTGGDAGADAGGDAGGDTGGDGSDGDYTYDPEDKRWVYKDGVWTDGYEVIYGPGNEGDQMSDAEMNGAWDTGEYSWEKPGEEVSDTDGDSTIITDIYGDISGPVSTGPDTGFGGVWGGGSDGGTTVPGGDAGGDAGGDSTGGDTGGEGTGGESGGDGSGDTGGEGGGGTGGEGAGGGGGSGGGTPGSGGGSGGGVGVGVGTGTGPGTGSGDGLDIGSDGGMMSSRGDYTPQWGELFAYTTLTPYQKKTLAPLKDYIKQAKGMLS